MVSRLGWDGRTCKGNCKGVNERQVSLVMNVKPTEGKRAWTEDAVFSLVCNGMRWLIRIGKGERERRDEEASFWALGPKPFGGHSLCPSSIQEQA